MERPFRGASCFGRAGRGRGRIRAELDRGGRAGRGELDDLDTVLEREVRVKPPPESAVELFRAVDIRDGDHDHLKLQVIAARASMTGFITPDYTDQYPQARSELAGWLRDGRLISREQIIDGGVRAFPAAVMKLFAGENVGKLIIAVAPRTV